MSVWPDCSSSFMQIQKKPQWPHFLSSDCKPNFLCDSNKIELQGIQKALKSLLNVVVHLDPDHNQTHLAPIKTFLTLSDVALNVRFQLGAHGQQLCLSQKKRETHVNTPLAKQIDIAIFTHGQNLRPERGMHFKSYLLISREELVVWRFICQSQKAIAEVVGLRQSQWEENAQSLNYHSLLTHLKEI